MTIGIVVALRDAVLLVADGRRGDAYRVHTDEADKIVWVREDLAVTTFGVEMGTDMAVAWMRNPGGLSRNGVEVSDQLADIAWAAATSVLQRVPEGDRTMPHMKVGLIAAGFDEDEGGYIAAGLFGSLMDKKMQAFQRAATGQVQFIVLGGEGADAQAQFGMAVKQHVDASDPLGLSAPPSVTALVMAAQRVVRSAAAQDRTIGGRGRYMILRRGNSIEQGFLPVP